MTDVGMADWPKTAAVFGASGGIGAAIAEGLLERGVERVYAGSRNGKVSSGEGIEPFSFDLEDETSIIKAAAATNDDPPAIVLVATGVLTLGDGTGPEKSYRALDAEAMAKVLHANTIGPAMIAKHMLPLLPRKDRGVFAALSARVGSIGDNGLGGWHSYRASKAALNMLLKNFAIELGRTHKQAVVCGLHPGTVETALSEPFQGNVAPEKLFTPKQSANYLLDVIEGLSPQDSGGVFDWSGERIPD